MKVARIATKKRVSMVSSTLSQRVEAQSHLCSTVEAVVVEGGLLLLLVSSVVGEGLLLVGSVVGEGVVLLVVVDSGDVIFVAGGSVDVVVVGSSVVVVVVETHR
jgi:hypothetical protein